MPPPQRKHQLEYATLAALPPDLLTPATMTLATVGAEGAPHAAPVYFAAEAGQRFYFFSDPASQHAIDLAQNPRAAAAIYPEVSGWTEIRGLQLRGAVQAVPTGPDWQAGWACYQAKFPFVAALKPLVARNQLYVFTPNWLRLVDNRQGFGYKQEWTLP